MNKQSKSQSGKLRQKMLVSNKSKLNGAKSALELGWTDRFQKEEEVGSEGERESVMEDCFDSDFDSDDEDEETEMKKGYTSEGSEESVEEGGDEIGKNLKELDNGGAVKKFSKNFTPVQGLRKLSVLSFMVTRKKPTFKAKRTLRKEIQSKGVDLKNSSMLTFAELDDMSDKESMIARRSLRDDLLDKGVDLGGTAKSNVLVAKRNLRATLTSSTVDAKKAI